MKKILLFFLSSLLFAETIVIEHSRNTIYFNTEWNVPEFTYYVLSREEIQNKVERRTGKFLTDPLYPYVVHDDYSKSGYDRGHLTPCDDMQFSQKTMEESFYMTNMAPQLHSFNAGIWKRCEELATKKCGLHGKMLCIQGCVVNDACPLVKHKIRVPKAFFKVIITPVDTECYLFEHESNGDLKKHKVPLEDILSINPLIRKTVNQSVL